MNNTIEATPQTGPIDQHFIAEHIYQLLGNCREDPDLGFCAHFSEKSKVGSQAFSYKGFRRVVANKKTPEGAFLNSNIVTKSSTFHVHKMYSCWSDSC